MIGFGQKLSVIHCVDLGCLSKAGEKYPNAGTPLYTSIAAHRGEGKLVFLASDD